MRRLIREVAAVVGLTIALAGCTAQGPVADPSVATDPSLTYDDRGDYAGVFGTVRTERTDGALCVYVDSTEGIGRGRVNLVFPAGYTGTAAGDVVDAAGSRVASAGDQVAVSVMPQLVDTVPPGCGSAGVGTAKALHIDLTH